MKTLLAFQLFLSPILFAQLPSYVPTNGLIAWYNFNANAQDESGNGHDGSVFGATLTDDSNGNPNAAYYFDGINDSIVIPHHIDFNVESTNEFTICYRIKVQNIQSLSNSILCAKQTSEGSNQDGWCSYASMNSSADLSFKNGPSSAGCAIFDQALSIYLGEYQHIVQVYQNGVYTLYVNSLIWGQYNCSGVFGDNLANLVIGAPSWESSSSFTFSEITIDEIGFWNRPLITCEVMDLWQADTPLTPISTVTQIDGQLVADDNNAMYQWVDCDNGNENIQGANQQSFSPSTTGNYAVVLSGLFGCMITSDCFYVEVLDVSEIGNDHLEIHPNPTNDVIKIDLTNSGLENSYVQITSPFGELIYSDRIQINQLEIDIRNLPNGLYFVTIANENTYYIEKIIKQ